MALPCPCCACDAAEGARAHAVLASLQDDDLDRALRQGLLDVAPCPRCGAACCGLLQDAQRARHAALQARERHRARQARLARRAAERERDRARPGSRPMQAASLPDAAADALARALARAAQRRPR